MTTASTISKKICIIGDFGVGKTSLIRRFVDHQFSDKYLSSIGVKISRKLVDLPEALLNKPQQMQMLIWDVEGSNKFKAIAPSYFQGAAGAVIVGDVTQEETLDHVTEHIKIFLDMNQKSYVAVALNKSDLIEAEYLASIRQIYQHKFDGKTKVLSTYFTSAKTGENVDEIFSALAHSLI
jgi:small GTP-binding protein